MKYCVFRNKNQSRALFQEDGPQTGEGLTINNQTWPDHALTKGPVPQGDETCRREAKHGRRLKKKCGSKLIGRRFWSVRTTCLDVQLAL